MNALLVQINVTLMQFVITQLEATIVLVTMVTQAMVLLVQVKDK